MHDDARRRSSAGPESEGARLSQIVPPDAVRRDPCAQFQLQCNAWRKGARAGLPPCVVAKLLVADESHAVAFAHLGAPGDHLGCWQVAHPEGLQNHVQASLDVIGHQAFIAHLDLVASLADLMERTFKSTDKGEKVRLAEGRRLSR